MPIAITPRRRSRNDFVSDEEESASPDMITSSQPDTTSTKRVRLTSDYTSPSFTGTPQTNGFHAQPNGTQREFFRSKITRRKHQPGSIVRVKLVNFVTYSAVEFFPGPSLNMVIGPNGTGKSTLVCAICLGLGWGPQHLGRAKEVSEFVKHGCQEATIEIELAKDGKKFKRNLVIRCTIKREGNKTTFSVDGKPMSKKAVIDICRSLSIQIDNLCQFLPQDKVVEFAAMTPIELLRSTQRAVASQEMIDMHEELKDLRKKQKDAQANCAADQETLANLEGRQRLQEADVERMREREQVEKRVKMLEAARPFAVYRKIRTLFHDIRDRKKEAQNELARLRNEVEPSLRAFNAKDRYHTQVKIVVGERKDAIAKAERHADGIDRKYRDLQDKQNELVSRSRAEVDSGRGARRDIARLELVITNLKRQLDEQPAEVDVQAYNERIREKRRAIETCSREIKELQNQQHERSHRGRQINTRIQQAETDLTNLDSQTGKQTAKLHGVSRDTAKLWEWVQQHQDEFEKPILGPPLVVCSVKDPRYADQIESLFQRSNMLAVTAQTKNDFKKLSDSAASRGWAEVYLKTMMAGMDNFRSRIGEDEMRRYGLEGWAIDHLDGPEPVRAMLCAEAHLHETGVGMRDSSQQQFEMLQNSSIQSWVTNRYSYRISRRREYGPGATSTQVKPLKPAQVWTDQPVDLTAKRELQEQIEDWREEISGLKIQNAEAQKSIDEFRQNMSATAEEEKDLSAEKAANQKSLGEFKALPTKLAAAEEKMVSAQNVIAGIKDRMRSIADEQDEVVLQRAQVALDYAKAIGVLRDCHNSLHEAELMFIEASSDAETLKELNSSVKELLEAQESQVKEVEKETEEARLEARRLLNICQRLLAEDNQEMDEETREFFKTMQEAQTVEELEGEIESEKARLELMHEGNGGVIREYETRKKRIDYLNARLEQFKDALNELDDEIKRLCDQWEPELDRLVEKISYSFSTNMEEISCAGEVGIHKDDDFDQWAIQIRVKFRENEPLTTLDSHRQSGGERAVSTIFYLMSLQSLTKSPFRVVDEINQGMDPRNERLVHKRMVGIACGNLHSPTPSSSSRPRPVPTRDLLNDDDNDNNNNNDTNGDADSDAVNDENDDDTRGGSQYFLITPKLLHNLTYERGMRVLCIASGEYMPPDRGRVDFKSCLDTMRGMRAGGFGVAAA